MNYNLYGDGTGRLTALLVLGFITLLAFFCGVVLIAVNKGRPRIWGFYMVVFSIFVGIACLLLYSSTRSDLW